MTKDDLKNLCEVKYKELSISKNIEYKEALKKINPDELDIFNNTFITEFTKDYIFSILSEFLPFDWEE